MDVKPINERRADSSDRVATGLFLAAFIAAVPIWARVLLLAGALLTYALSEGFAQMARGEAG